MSPKNIVRVAALAEALEHAGITEPARGVEVGVWMARMSCAMMDLWPTLHLTLVDQWKGYTDGSTVRGDAEMRHLRGAALGRLQSGPYASRHTLLEMSSVAAARTFYGQPGWADFVFIDADHSFDACLLDCRAWLPVVRPGGLLCGHDYGPYKDVETGVLEPEFGVTDAVYLFCAARGLAFWTGGDSTWFVKKP